MRKRAPTSTTSSVRSTAIARSSRTAFLAALIAAVVCAPAGAARRAVPDVAVTTILAAYERATHSENIDSIEFTGTIAGEGMTGEFHTWRSGDRERDDERLGPRVESTLRIGDRLWVRNPNGNVRELRGVLRRRAVTSDFIESGTFLAAPARSKYVGEGTIAGRAHWRIEVNAPGGEPVMLWIDEASGLPTRTETVDGDGPTYVDVSDWRTIAGHPIAFHSVTTDGDRAFDVIEETTSVTIGGAIDPVHFAPLEARRLHADGVQTVPLVEVGSHVAATVRIEGKPFTFLIDSGAQNILLDSRVAKSLGLQEEGALEVRGAVRTGGLHVTRVPQLEIGAATLDELVVSTIDLGTSLGALRVDGILGYPFFAASTVELDFFTHVMRFGPPGSFEPKGQRVELDVDREIAEATFRINERLDAPFIVDTGNSGELLFYRPFLDRHPGLLPGRGVGSVNYGVGGSNRTYRTQLDTLRLGEVPMYHQNVDVVLASSGAFADRIDAGNVGLGLLRNFVTTFDYTNAAMYLTPNATFDDGRRRTVTTS